ncbi:nucleotidyl transferase AbiEii/AbiGii toxin family protein [Rhizobacter sp. OV335]|jgi:predicted nucleotidyltransferase component of viral defense system|uniref:nucleotidyl transferase AbiEii/AbiGii toxin family protein n=1 Tax=Rhizobacter sp. OV335 TaxID=1500264 RepID=UPI0009208D39|nr:nucleotidyl transferase AbiEii/AbiGii toxin family protein [Rhizobacter sp. OV335]SHM70536.1 Nucleotidyl transferase AbiEii toxin, Type IV TA system [Rhizobacter sp. OV335]
MRALPPERLELIDALVAEADTGGVTAALLEKDEHLTDALHAIFGLKLEHATLVFCGGSSLSKAHGLIERMSEDADIKVALADSTVAWSKNKVRRYLGDEVRGRIAETMATLGFTEDADKRRSLNDNRYLHSQWAYERRHDGIAALRPHLQIELVVRRPVLSTASAQIDSLADRLSARTVDTPPIVVVAVAETLAEKLLSFLRRFAQHRAGQMSQPWDTTLVRHIYDAHCIVLQAPMAVKAACEAFVTLTMSDVEEFGYQDTAFAVDPKAVMAGALQAAGNDRQTRDEYERNLLPLVYGKNKYGFDETWSTFQAVATRLLATL